MGIASRTKWERRVRLPLPLVENLDPAKLAHRAMLASRAVRQMPMFAERRERAAKAKAKAEAKRAAHRVRRRKAAALCGWRPHAQR